MLLGSMDSFLPPRSDRASLRLPLRQLSLGQDPLPASPLISHRNLVPGLSESMVQLDMLGKGATSNVFLAVHAATLKMVALKEVTVSSDADRRAVRTEMRALKTQRSPLLDKAFTTELASCPWIVDYYGSVLLRNGNACIAVEYVGGGSLENWIEERSGSAACPEPWFAHIAHQALEALDFVHSGRRVHRDVKPANLLITRNGDLKLGDFGTAGVENSSRMIGTQRFMAPERLKGWKATAQSDLWSLGLSFATAVLGDDFLKHADSQFAQLDVASSVKRTLAKVTTISEDFKSFLHLCLSKHPAHRPALKELMRHAFLDQRQDWQAKCPEVAVAVRGRKRLRGDPNALSTDQVLDRLCRARAEGNLDGSDFDPATAADLAAELGVTAPFLAREVHRRTLEFIRQRGGSGSGSGGVSDSGGDSDSGGENEKEATGGDGGRRDATGSGGGGGGSAISSDGERRRRRRTPSSGSSNAAADEGRDNNECQEERQRSSGVGRRDGSSRSSLPRPPPPPPPPPAPSEGAESAMEVVPTASVDDESSQSSGSGSGSGGNNSFPPVTPRNRPTTAGGSTGTAGGFGSSSRRRATSSSKRSRRRTMEMTSSVKLTPHKRRGEKKASQTKRNGSRCAADGARHSGRRRERERRTTGGAGKGAEPAHDPSPEAPKETSAAAGAAAEPAEGAGPETAVEAATAAVVVPPTHRNHSKERSSRSTTAATTGSSDFAHGEPSLTTDVAARRRSWQRKSKKDNKPRTSSSRTLPSRTDFRMRSMRGVFQLADEMKAQIAVRDRMHRLRVYPNCFSGREAVQWMLDGCHASTVKEAENIGNEMMKASVFQHILNSHVFEDSGVYYQFTDGETPPPPSRGGRRLRQIARVVGGSVARRLVHSGGGSNSAVIGSGGGTVNGSGAGVEAARATPAEPARVRGGGDAARAAAVDRTSFSRGGASRQPPQQQQVASRSGERNSKTKRRSRGRGAQSVCQFHRLNSSMSTLTVPETPY